MAVMVSLDPRYRPIPQLLDIAAFMAAETQDLLHERYGGYPTWSVDLNADPPQFRFESPERSATFRPHFVGSTSAHTGTWMWGWNNINRFPEPAVALAGTLRRIGTDLGDPDLTTPTLPLAGRDNLPNVLVAAAQAVVGEYAWYRAPTDDAGSAAWFVLAADPAEFTLGESKPHILGKAIINALSVGQIVDHRAALHHYAEQRGGITVTETRGANPAGPLTVVLSMAAGDLTVDFDDAGHISRTRNVLNRPEDLHR